MAAVLCLQMTTVTVAAQKVEENQVTLLSYIYTSVWQAFNTGYTHKANTRIEMDCIVKKFASSNHALFGACLKDHNNNAFCFYTRHSGQENPWLVRTGSEETNGEGLVYDERITVIAEGQTVKWYRHDDLSTVVGSVTTTGTADDGKTPMLLFSQNVASTEGGVLPDAEAYSRTTFYGCKIYEGETLMCDFVPALYNNTAGIYDRVNKTFGGSLTDAEFKYDSDVEIQVHYEQALSSIEDGKSYRVFTVYNGKKYYVTDDGHLSTDLADAPLFKFKKVEGEKYPYGFQLQNDNTYFTNPKTYEESALTLGCLNTTNTQARNTWEAQVFFLNSQGKYAIRCTNAADEGSSWNWVGSTYWTVNAGTDGPLAEYSFSMNYVWQLEEPGELITYPVWLGSTQVTSYNMYNVLGNKTVSYTPGEGTGTLTFSSATPAISGYYNDAKIYAEDIDLTISAPNGLTFTSELGGIYTGGDKELTINGDMTITANGSGGSAIKSEGNITLVAGSMTLKALGSAMNAKGAITLPEIATITTPDCGMVKQIDDRTHIVAADGTTIAKQVVIKMPKVIDVSTIKADYVAQDGELLTGTLGGFYKVSIADGATVTLYNLTIHADPSGYDASWDTNYRWAGLTCEGTATIILKGTNTVKGFCNEFPGLYVPESKTLTIQGSGSLNAISGGNPNNDYYLSSPGIGAGLDLSCGRIVIKEGTITATGGSYAAGIGAGWAYTKRVACGDITISGGTVTATGGVGGAGIGSGYGYGANSVCGHIVINGGTVTAIAGDMAAAIGSGSCNDGFSSSCGSVVVTDGIDQLEVGIRQRGDCSYIGTGVNGTCGGVNISDKLAYDQEEIKSSYYSITYRPATKLTYPVWVGATQVAYLNKDDILGDGTVSYNSKTHTLTFTSATTNIKGMHDNAKIYAEDINLNISAPKGLTLDAEGYGIYVKGAGGLKLLKGSLTLSGATSAICCGGDITFPDTHEISRPTGGQAQKVGDETHIVAANGTIAKKAVIRKKAIDLATVGYDFVAKDGDVLTGTFPTDKKYGISIADGATVTLRDATLCPQLNGTGIVNCRGNATIILERTNTISAPSGNTAMTGGIQIVKGYTLTIDGSGSLYAEGSSYGPAIGCFQDAGDIVINGGVITAIGGSYAAGIGSGNDGDCADITINGGTVTAVGGPKCAGIGSGCRGNYGSIYIRRGIAKVMATCGEGCYPTLSCIGAGKDGTGQAVSYGGVTSTYDGNTRILTGDALLTDGDANGDSTVSITDAVGVVDFILGNESDDFHYGAADVNHDGKVTITDAVGVVDIILDK